MPVRISSNDIVVVNDMYDSHYQLELKDFVVGCDLLKESADIGNVKAFSITFSADSSNKVLTQYPILRRHLNTILMRECNVFYMVGILLNKGSYIPEHTDNNIVIPGNILVNHPLYTTIYYAKADTNISGGDLIFSELNKCITPQTNMMVQFPSIYPHSVTAITSDSQRVCIVVEQYKLIDFYKQKLMSPLYERG